MKRKDVQKECGGCACDMNDERRGGRCKCVDVCVCARGDVDLPPHVEGLSMWELILLCVCVCVWKCGRMNKMYINNIEGFTTRRVNTRVLLWTFFDF